MERDVEEMREEESTERREIWVEKRIKIEGLEEGGEDKGGKESSD